jgi:cytochrome c553
LADWLGQIAQQITVYPAFHLSRGIKDRTRRRKARKGETCAGCHDQEAADMGKKIVSGEKIEPTPIKGKAGSIPVTVQAALDDSKLYLRFQWKQPPASGGAKMDKDNPVKLAVMLEDNKVEMANLAGCWTCHGTYCRRQG